MAVGADSGWAEKGVAVVVVVVEEEDGYGNGSPWDAAGGKRSGIGARWKRGEPASDPSVSDGFFSNDRCIGMPVTDSV